MTTGMSSVRADLQAGTMNHHHDHEHVNGHHVNGERPTEEELDAYQEQFTNEAVLDQVKVYITPPSRTS